MWEVCKIMFTLSHGQSSVERVFMVNKQCSIENVQGKSLIVLRRVAHHISASEEIPEEFQITKDILHYVFKGASRKYKEDLCQQRQEKENE